jgi:REP element-mobilizing transposase RayT
MMISSTQPLEFKVSPVTQEKLKTHPSISTSQFDEKEVSDSNQDITLDLLDPVNLELYSLSYTCLSIPRFPSHQLKGDLADYLSQWMQQICISYGWRLEFITVQPEYFQWAMVVPPSTSPSRFMQQIRNDTSKMILAAFGHISKENLSNDFWAPGYLVVLGTRPHLVEMISQYIRLTRRQQGLNTLVQPQSVVDNSKGWGI